MSVCVAKMCQHALSSLPWVRIYYISSQREQPVAPFKNLIEHAGALNGLFKGKGQCLTQGQTHSRLLKNVLKMEQSLFSGKVESQSDLFFLFGLHTIWFYNYILIPLFPFTSHSRLYMYVCACICAHMDKDAYVLIYVCMYICVKVCVYASLFVCIDVCLSVNMCVCVF